MYSKKYCFFILLLCSFFKLQAQFIKIPKLENSRKNIEALLLQNKNFSNDTISLKNYLSPLVKTEKFKVIYHAMLANGYYNVFDKLNKQSNYQYLQSITLAKRSDNLTLILWTQLNYISYLYNYRAYNELTPLFLDVLNQLQNIPPNQVIFPGESFKKIAWILQSLGDYQAAEPY